MIQLSINIIIIYYYCIVYVVRSACIIVLSLSFVFLVHLLVIVLCMLYFDKDIAEKQFLELTYRKYVKIWWAKLSQLS